MKINLATEKGIQNLQDVLDDIQKRCTVRTVTAKEIATACNGIFHSLDIPKKHLNGTSAVIDLNAQDFPNAYKYTPESTKVCVAYANNHWSVTDAYRGACAKAYHKAEVSLSESAKSAILDNYSTIWKV